MKICLNHCWLSRISERDWIGFHDLFSNHLVREMNGADTDIKASFERYLSNDASFSVFVQDRMVGTVSLFDTSLSKAVRSLSTRELTYALMPDQWGKGIMHEAVSYICNQYAKELGLDVIFAGSFLGNERSSSVLRNQGFRLVFIRYGEHEEKIFVLAPELWKHTV